MYSKVSIEIRESIKNHYHNFRAKCLAIVEEIDEFNTRQTSNIGLPDLIVTKFVNLINE